MYHNTPSSGGIQGGSQGQASGAPNYNNYQQQSAYARPSEEPTGIVSKQRLALLIDQISGERGTNVDEVVEEIIQDLVDDYISNTTRVACMLAKHRNSDTLEPRDVKRAILQLPKP